MKKVLFSVLALLIFSSALSLTAYEYLNDLNSKLKNGKVLSISFFDSEKQDFMTFELGENESSENNFELKEGYAYLILTNLSNRNIFTYLLKGF